MALTITNHPLIQHKLSILRDKRTGSKEFRSLISEIATLLCYEATRDLPLMEVEVETPIAKCKTKVIAGKKLCFVPILRAGTGMLDGVLQMVPSAKVGHIGMYRDPETALPVPYYCKLPDISLTVRFSCSIRCLQRAARLSTPSIRSRRTTRCPLSSCASSPLPRDLRLFRRLIPTLIFTVRRLTTILTSTSTSFRA